ncbi:MAG TPA: CAP domain-containing protein [Thermoanaerobaculia bacterium]|nr:CAP domain-containing protein [Thermoanaerobaculia bacterium]
MKLTRTAPLAVLALAAACAPHSAPPPEPPAPPARVVAPPPGGALAEEYPAPSSPSEPVRRAVFERINADRAAAGLAPVAWDEGAARVADAFCAAQVAEKTNGHFLRDGVPPYARTGLAGVFGYQAENVASWSTTSKTFSDTPLSLALAAHRSMMGETPPDDGHRRTILDPEATHVGVGWAMTGGRFQIAQEFLARGLDRAAVRNDERGIAVRVSASARAPYRVAFVTIAREALPRPLSAEEASGRTSYSYPRASRAFVPEGHRDIQIVGVPTEDRLRLGHDRDFEIALAPDGPGLYTLVFWLVRKGEDQGRPLGSLVIRAER